MKKIFTLMAMAAMAMGASAQVQVLPDFDLGEKDGAPVVAGKLPAEYVLVDDANLKATTVWEANCGINDAKFSVVEEALGTLTKWIEVRVDKDPSETDPYGVQQDGKTPIVFSPKADLDLTVYYRTGPGKAIVMTNMGDNSAVAAENVKEVGDPASEKNALFVYNYKLEADNDYVLTQRGGTGRFYGFAYTAEGGSDEPAKPEVLASWDFTKWSEATIANLKDGENWSDIEKADGTNPTDGKCYWQVKATEALSTEKYVMANNLIIGELEGLVYTNEKSDRSLAIAVDYPSTSLGEYHGPQYLWLGSKNINYFIIPEVPAGATIKMGVESHKSSEARGVKLSVAGAELMGPDGNAVALPTTYEEQEWVVPATAAEKNDVQITNSNGCHLYFITVIAGEGGDTSAVEAVEAVGAVEYYNLQGVRVANPENGLYIKRQGNKAVKVLVK